MNDQKAIYMFEENSNYMSDDEKKLHHGKEVAQSIFNEVQTLLKSSGITGEIKTEELSEMLQDTQSFLINKIMDNIGDVKVPGTSISYSKDKHIELIEKPSMEKLSHHSNEFAKINSYFKFQAYTLQDNIIEIKTEVLNNIRESYSVKADTPEKKELLETHQELLKNLNRFNELFHTITGERAFFHTLGAGKLIPQMFLYNEEQNIMELKKYYYKENSWRFKK
jgi:hypothetical protein